MGFDNSGCVKWFAMLLLVVCGSLRAQPLQRVGQGQYTYFVFKVYQATLWSIDGRFTDYQQRPLKLELTYQRAIRKDEFINATLEQWRHVAPSQRAQQLQWAAQLEQIWRDVQTGDRLASVLNADQSTTFLFNDQPIGQISDAAFGPAFFDIWLSKKTTAPKLRAALLGKKDER